LISPTREEELGVERIIGRDVPTPDEREALEESARNFTEDGAYFFTPTLLGRRDDGPFVSGPVTFMLHEGRLVTIRTVNPRAFEIGSARASARILDAETNLDVAAALIEGSIERIADLLAEQSDQANTLSTQLTAANDKRDLRSDLKAISRLGAITALCHASLSSLQRSVIFLTNAGLAAPLDRERMYILRRDIEELERQSEAVQQRISFMQAFTLGLINVNQTDVLKALSLAAIAFIPATLIASIFGMNFEAMNWYESAWGPVAAFSLMALAPVVLFCIARWRKWF
jgi:magnesium transporter